MLLFPNDIAVLRVKGKINLANPNIEKIEMAPDDGYNYTDSKCWITGWGFTQGINIIITVYSKFCTEDSTQLGLTIFVDTNFCFYILLKHLISNKG